MYFDLVCRHTWGMPSCSLWSVYFLIGYSVSLDVFLLITVEDVLCMFNRLCFSCATLHIHMCGVGLPSRSRVSHTRCLIDMLDASWTRSTLEDFFCFQK